MIFVLVVLLAISAAIAENEGCKPKSQFMDYCNTCFCDEDGVNFMCTMMLCDEKVWNADGTKKEHPKHDRVSRSVEDACEPGSQFKKYCNTCTCAADGSSASCTRMMCDVHLWNVNGTLKLRPDSLRVYRSVNEVCTPRSHFNDFCNACSCSDDGMSFGCTRMMCDEKIWHRNGTLRSSFGSQRFRRSATKQVCAPGSQFKNYCNTCGCSDDGTSYACTRMMCDENIWNKDGTLKVVPNSKRMSRSTIKQVCQPRSHFMEYCNTCACSEDGMSYGCTRMMCDKQIWNRDGTLKVNPNAITIDEKSQVNQVCQPRFQVKHYCNTCTCSDDGTSFACTRMMCDKTIWNADGTLKVEIETNRVARSVCKPRSHFKDYCNTCTCSDDGLSYSCTKMACDKQIWNQDGSQKPFPVAKTMKR